jgi:hypothetical protein
VIPAPEHNRRRFQFSLRTVFAVVTIAAILVWLLGVVTDPMWRAIIYGAIFGAISYAVALAAIVRFTTLGGNKLCPSCGEKLPPLRLPRNRRQFMVGGWTCAGCHQAIDRFGDLVER